MKIRDVSFSGSDIIIDNEKISDFMDDANPIDIQDTEVANIEWSCNGSMVRTVKPSAIIISITVIPNSPSDAKLRHLWERCFSNGGSVDLNNADTEIKGTIENKAVGFSYKLEKGTCLSGAAAVTANGMGKMGGNTYTFAFAKVTAKAIEAKGIGNANNAYNFSNKVLGNIGPYSYNIV